MEPSNRQRATGDRSGAVLRKAVEVEGAAVPPLPIRERGTGGEGHEGRGTGGLGRTGTTGCYAGGVFRASSYLNPLDPSPLPTPLRRAIQRCVSPNSQRHRTTSRTTLSPVRGTVSSRTR